MEAQNAMIAALLHCHENEVAYLLDLMEKHNLGMADVIAQSPEMGEARRPISFDDLMYGVHWYLADEFLGCIVKRRIDHFTTESFDIY